MANLGKHAADGYDVIAAARRIDNLRELAATDPRIEPFALDVTDDASVRGQRVAYFRELFRLQRELVTLQDWVAHTRQKVVILFEGRDAAGKGGAIKRITQRLNPRVCRVVASSGRVSSSARASSTVRSSISSSSSSS